MNAEYAHPGPRYEALLQLLRTADTLWNASRRFFAPWNLNPSQFNVLNLLLSRDGGWTQIELSRTLIMHRSNLTGLIDQLERRGLVQRADDPADRRAYQVRLTSKGRRVLQEILPHYYRAAETVWGNVPSTRTRQIASDLRTLAAQAEQMVNPLPQEPS